MSEEYAVEATNSFFVINGKSLELNRILSVSDLVEQLGYSGKRIAVELNGDVVPRSQHSVAWINAGDRCEIVIAVGGG